MKYNIKVVEFLCILLSKVKKKKKSAKPFTNNQYDLVET